jgi:phosphoenolpyruvate synthase/pyruvate phosphate dikinase
VAAVYRFLDDCEDKMLLGNKGANLVTMTKIGLRVPPGFVVSIEAYVEYRRTGRLPIEDIDEGLHWLEGLTGKRLGDGLMVSVRSSAPVSMPGMMDTLLNIKSKAHMISAIKKIFGSWDNLRAVEYRRLNNIPRDIGTSAVVQAMVMGLQHRRTGALWGVHRPGSGGGSGLRGQDAGPDTGTPRRNARDLRRTGDRCTDAGEVLP